MYSILILTLSHPKPTRPLTTRISRKLHSLPIPAFICDISSFPTSMSAELHTSLSSTIDKYAPVFTKTSITRPDSSWYTISLLNQKRILRKAEKSYLKHPSPTSFAYYNNLKNIHRKAISITKASHKSSPTNSTISLMTVSSYTDFLLNCLVVHLNPLSPLSPLKNYQSSSKNISMKNFPPPFPPFPPVSFPPLPSPFPSPLKNCNLP